MIHRSWCGQSDQPDDHRSLVPRAYFRRRTLEPSASTISRRTPDSSCPNLERTTLPSSDRRRRALPHPIDRAPAFDRIGWHFASGPASAFPRIPQSHQRTPAIAGLEAAIA
jgi:hypothetical protein